MINKILKTAISTATIIAITAIPFSFANQTTPETLENLSEFNLLDFMRDHGESPNKNNIDTSSYNFNNHFFSTNLYKQSTDKLAFSTIKFNSDYKNYEVTQSKLDHIEFKNIDTLKDLQINATNTHIFARIYNYKCHGFDNTDQAEELVQEKSCESYLLQSSNGTDWSSAYTFDNSWKYPSLMATDNKLLLSYHNQVPSKYGGYNYEARLAYFNESDSSFNQIILPKVKDGITQSLSFSTVFDNKVFIRTHQYGNYPEQSGYKYYIASSADIEINPKWHEINFPQFKTETVDGKEVKLEFSFIHNISKVGEYYLAEASYYRVLSDTETSYAFQEDLLISKDNGLTWDFLNIKLKDQEIEAIFKHNDKYHIFSEDDNWDDDSDSDSDSESDSDDDSRVPSAEEIIQMFKESMEKSSVNHYVLTEEQINSTEVLNLEPNYVYNNYSFDQYLENKGIFSLYYLDDDKPTFGFFKIK